MPQTNQLPSSITGWNVRGRRFTGLRTLTFIAVLPGASLIDDPRTSDALGSRLGTYTTDV
jgi:hypothetical protein